jgi:hypothetical protein
VLSGQGLRGSILLQEHHEDLVFDRLGQRHPAENLSGHHARKKTTPVTDIELITGISALRSDKFPGYTLIALRVASIPETIACVEGKRHCANPGMRDPDRNVIELRGRKLGVIEGVTRYVL